MKSIPVISTGSYISIMVDSRMRTFKKDHFNYDKVSKIVNNINLLVNDINIPALDRATMYSTYLAELKEMLDIPSFIARLTEGRVQVGDNQVLFEGEPLHNVLTEKLMKMLQQGMDIRPMSKFLDKLMNNPSDSARKELYLWMEQAKLPITSEGNILAFKSVRNDYMDHYSRTIRNKIGDEPEMDREEVDDDRTRTCSRGLHFCAWSYIPEAYTWKNDDRIMLLEINPADVVAIPNDYDNAKGRCWKYKVVGQVPKDEVLDLFDTPVMEEFIHDGQNHSFAEEEENYDCYSCEDDEEYCDCEEDEQELPESYAGSSTERCDINEDRKRVTSVWDCAATKEQLMTAMEDVYGEDSEKENVPERDDSTGNTVIDEERSRTGANDQEPPVNEIAVKTTYSIIRKNLIDYLDSDGFTSYVLNSIDRDKAKRLFYAVSWNSTDLAVGKIVNSIFNKVEAEKVGKSIKEFMNVLLDHIDNGRVKLVSEEKIVLVNLTVEDTKLTKREEENIIDEWYFQPYKDN